jgi:hypothetical protein
MTVLVVRMFALFSIASEDCQSSVKVGGAASLFHPCRSFDFTYGAVIMLCSQSTSDAACSAGSGLLLCLFKKICMPAAVTMDPCANLPDWVASKLYCISGLTWCGSSLNPLSWLYPGG